MARVKLNKCIDLIMDACWSTSSFLLKQAPLLIVTDTQKYDFSVVTYPDPNVRNITYIIVVGSYNFSKDGRFVVMTYCCYDDTKL